MAHAGPTCGIHTARSDACGHTRHVRGTREGTYVAHIGFALMQILSGMSRLRPICATSVASETSVWHTWGTYVPHTLHMRANVPTRGTHVAHVGHICATLESRVDETVIRCGPAAAHMCHVGGLGDFYVAHLGPRVCHIWRCLNRGFSHCAHVSPAMVSICECALHILCVSMWHTCVTRVSKAAHDSCICCTSVAHMCHTRRW